MSWCNCGCTCVSQGETAFIERCGQFNRSAEPGCHCLWPCCCERVAGVVSLRLQQLDVTCETKTHDNVFITIVTSVQYQAQEENVVQTFYRLSNPHEQIRAYVEDVVRQAVPSISLDDVFEQKDHIAKTVHSSLEKTMAEFGFVIIKALVTDIVPDERVKESMNAINAAKRLRIAASDEAEADKIRVVKAAEAEAERNYLHGKGIAKSRKEVMRGMKEAVADFQNDVGDVKGGEVMNMMLMSQYFDMLKDVGAADGTNTIFIPHVPGAVSGAQEDILGAMRQGAMEASGAGVGGNNVISPAPRAGGITFNGGSPMATTTQR